MTTSLKLRSARALVGVALVSALLAAFAAALALAGSSATVGAAHNGKIKQTILVSAQGRTLYALAPETSHHLICTSHACLETWPPLTVSHGAKPRAASGVHGSLGTVPRPGGREQVTINGLPLYMFAGDRGKGEANGEGIKSFGGTWHVILASSGRPH